MTRLTAADVAEPVRSGPICTDYNLTAKQARELMGAVLLPAEIRRKVLALYARKHGQAALIDLFAQIIGLANSVVANTCDMVELELIVAGVMHPDRPDQGPNLPTLFGALSGVALAEGIDQAPLCHGCAFRLGTPANQSPITTCDADWCSHPGEEPFYCHEDRDENDDPTRGCAGFAQMRKRRTKDQRKV